ncbi:MAG TPA: DUF4340 domain-containing protein [Opitutaceae bacterium]|nr:DUF4340 domain-containing protein [Opitutaceae bacterium]
MRTKVTLVLLFLNAALFLFIFKFERRWRTDEAALHVRHRVLTTEAADIRSIEVTGAGPSFRLEKREEGWFLTKPFDWPANPNAVSRMTNELKLLESDVSFSVSEVQKNNLSLADYGLDHPRLTVTFTSGGPDTTGRAPITTTLKVGDASKNGQSLYLLSSDGARIYVVGRDLAESLQPALDQLRSDDVLNIQVFEARLLSIETRAAPGLKVRLQRDGSRWSFESPIPTRADKTATELAVNGLNALRVRRFIENPGVPLPSADPEMRISLQGDNRRETLFLGAPVDPAAAPGARQREYYAQREGRAVLFTVMMPVGPDSLLETLNDAQEVLRDRHVLDFDPESVTTVVLSAPGGQPDLTLQRLEAAAGPAAASWQIVLPGGAREGPQTLPADTAAVQQLLERLAGLTAVTPGGFVSDAPEAADLEKWGFNRPARVITLGLSPAPGAPPSASQIVLQVGQGQERGAPAYARLENGLSVYKIDPALVDETPLAPTAWRNRLLHFLPDGAQVSGLTLTDQPAGRVLLEWTGAPGTPPPPAAAPLLESLRTLRAQRFVQDRFSDPVRDPGGEERPWRYRLDVSISLPAGAGGAQAGTRTLLFTDRVGGTVQLAGSRELGAVFTLEQPVIDALWSLTYGGRDPGARK